VAHFVPWRYRLFIDVKLVQRIEETLARIDDFDSEASGGVQVAYRNWTGKWKLTKPVFKDWTSAKRFANKVATSRALRGEVTFFRAGTTLPSDAS
jgi:hypothetical protein